MTKKGMAMTAGMIPNDKKARLSRASVPLRPSATLSILDERRRMPHRTP